MAVDVEMPEIKLEDIVDKNVQKLQGFATGDSDKAADKWESWYQDLTRAKRQDWDTAMESYQNELVTKLLDSEKKNGGNLPIMSEKEAKQHMEDFIIGMFDAAVKSGDKGLAKLKEQYEAIQADYKAAKGDKKEELYEAKNQWLQNTARSHLRINPGVFEQFKSVLKSHTGNPNDIKRNLGQLMGGLRAQYVQGLNSRKIDYITRGDGEKEGVGVSQFQGSLAKKMTSKGLDVPGEESHLLLTKDPEEMAGNYIGALDQLKENKGSLRQYGAENMYDALPKPSIN